MNGRYNGVSGRSFQLGPNDDVKLPKGHNPINAKFALAKCEVPDLARAQQQFGAFVPALAQQKLVVREGKLSVKTSGSYDGKTLTLAEPLNVTLPGVTVERDGQPLLSRETITFTTSGTVQA